MASYIQGILTSLSVFVLTLVFSIPLGCLIAVFRVKNIPIVSIIVRAFIDIVRGTPLILQLLFFYFVPYFVFGINVPRFPSVIFTFSINYAAYFAEIFRSGYISLPVGQKEACKILGLSRTFSFFRIYVPQIVKRIIPAFSGEVVTLVKDTALSSTLGIMELFAIAQKRSNASFSIEPLIIAGIFYFIFNGVVSFAFNLIEKKLNRYSI